MKISSSSRTTAKNATATHSPLILVRLMVWWGTSGPGGRGWAGGLSCGFDTYEHCLENARLINANCVPNPFVDPYPQQGSPRTAKPR